MEELGRSVKQGVLGSKRAAAGVCISSPPEAPARGKSIVIGVGTPTSYDFEKLLKAYNSMKEEKRISDMEVQALKERFEKAVAKLVKQGRTPRSNLTKRIYEATDDEDLDNHGRREERRDDLTIRPSPPKRTFGRLAKKAAATKRAEFLKETKKYLKRLKKHDLQLLCGKEGITFITCEQVINEIAELRTALAFDDRQQKRARSIPDSEPDDNRDDDHDGVGGHATQPVEVDEDEQIVDE
ncbi:hypothetical protein CBR_g36437 [Chara braunii]|uniref:Uncharacterized protein n=1 Tax=Chara braunii TaxID=69332 RepID=A0A388LKQ2_CHABU|nr:hypothetical protein CBR_g36437 [Chara braunii]|eukprot:GBG82910.1 hypothetical protein CBR_g36437 [Chara braunii]